MLRLKNKLRKIIFRNLNQKTIDNFYRIYYRIKYSDEMERKCSYGELNPNKVFYVIRPRIDKTEGLMSLFVNVAKNLYYAAEKGCIPVVDFENYHTQYNDIVNGEKNSWNFYFTQPTEVTLSEVYNSKNVILSGLEIQWYRPSLFVKKFDDVSLSQIHKFIFNKFTFNDVVLASVNSETENIGLDFEKTLGLYLRGTDYVALKPSGHPVQPTVDQADKMVKSFLQKYEISNIFLVTEDEIIFKTIKERYGSICVVASFDSFITNYRGKKFLSHDKSINELGKSPYKRGLNYLVKIIMLSKCKYLIGGDTMGSWAACIFSEKAFREKYIFNLGVYGK